MKWTMIAAILSATVLLGAAWGAAAAPQYLSNYAGPHPVHLDSEESAHYHFHHFHHHHHELQHMEVSSRSAELEDPGAEKR